MDGNDQISKSEIEYNIQAKWLVKRVPKTYGLRDKSKYRITATAGKASYHSYQERSTTTSKVALHFNYSLFDNTHKKAIYERYVKPKPCLHSQVKMRIKTPHFESAAIADSI